MKIVKLRLGNTHNLRDSMDEVRENLIEQLNDYKKFGMFVLGDLDQYLARTIAEDLLPRVVDEEYIELDDEYSNDNEYVDGGKVIRIATTETDDDAIDALILDLKFEGAKPFNVELKNGEEFREVVEIDGWIYVLGSRECIASAEEVKLIK